MAQKSINWNDGSTDVLDVEYTGTAGASAMSFSTPIDNEWTDREITVTASTITGNNDNSDTVVVKQEGKRQFYNVEDESASGEGLRYKCSDGKYYCVLKENIA